MTRYFGFDAHREFAQVAVVEDGLVRDLGQVECRSGPLRARETMTGADQACLEATGNSEAIASTLGEVAGRVVVSNPVKTRAIAEAKAKTDKVDARILAQLLAADFLPPVWQPDERTARLRRLVAARTSLVHSRAAVKNQVHAVLARNLLPKPAVSDLFGKAGRAWLAMQALPEDEHARVASLLRRLDFLGAELAEADKALAGEALQDAQAGRLMTIPGISVTVAMSIIAAAGDFTRFPAADKLVAYLGLHPKVRQSGGQVAHHGRITKHGNAHARGMLVEAAFTAAQAPGPLRAFFNRVKARRGFQVAVVATARKMTALAWTLATRGEDHAFARPSLVAFKRRQAALTAGAPKAHARRGPGHSYNDPVPRREERAPIEQAERAYELLTSNGNPTGLKANQPPTSRAWPRQGLDFSIRGADDPPGLRVPRQERCELLPRVLPQPDDRGYFLPQASPNSRNRSSAAPTVGAV